MGPVASISADNTRQTAKTWQMTTILREFLDQAPRSFETWSLPTTLPSRKAHLMNATGHHCSCHENFDASSGDVSAAAAVSDVVSRTAVPAAPMVASALMPDMRAVCIGMALWRSPRVLPLAKTEPEEAALRDAGRTAQMRAPPASIWFITEGGILYPRTHSSSLVPLLHESGRHLSGRGLRAPGPRRKLSLRKAHSSALIPSHPDMLATRTTVVVKAPRAAGRRCSSVVCQAAQEAPATSRRSIAAALFAAPLIAVASPALALILDDEDLECAISYLPHAFRELHAAATARGVQTHWLTRPPLFGGLQTSREGEGGSPAEACAGEGHRARVRCCQQEGGCAGEARG